MKNNQRKSEIEKYSATYLPPKILLTYFMCYCSQGSNIKHLDSIFIDEATPIVHPLQKKTIVL